QDDSMLQRLLDSAKTASATPSPTTVKKDTIKRNAARTIKKDSVKTALRQTDSLFAADSLLKGLSDSIPGDSASTTVPAQIKKPLSWIEDTAFMNLLKIPYIKKKVQPALHDGDLRMPLNSDYL